MHSSDFHHTFHVPAQAHLPAKNHSAAHFVGMSGIPCWQRLAGSLRWVMHRPVPTIRGQLHFKVAPIENGRIPAQQLKRTVMGVAGFSLVLWGGLSLLIGLGNAVDSEVSTRQSAKFWLIMAAVCIAAGVGCFLYPTR